MNVFFGTLLAAFALLLLWFANRQRRQLGIPQGEILFEDMGGSGKLHKPLYDADLDLVGRPDYLVREGQQLIPVEVKSGKSPRQAYESHIFQLAAYCILVERNYGTRPSYGLIRYPERTFKINFTAQLETDLLSILEEMRSALIVPDLDRSHGFSTRCRSCGFLEICDQSL